MSTARSEPESNPGRHRVSTRRPPRRIRSGTPPPPTCSSRRSSCCSACSCWRRSWCSPARAPRQWILGFDTGGFLGAENYATLLSGHGVLSEEFWSGMRVTAIFTVLSVPLLVVVPFGLALLLNRALPGSRRFFRAVYFAPYVLGVAVVGRAVALPARCPRGPGEPSAGVAGACRTRSPGPPPCPAGLGRRSWA